MTKNIFDIEKHFESMRNQMNQLMNGFLTESFDKNIPLVTNNNLISQNFTSPKTDIYETPNEVIAEIEIPGIKKEDIKLNVENGVLNLKAEQKYENKDEKKGYHRIERSYMGYNKSFTLPTPVDENHIKASYKDGILEVSMPKKEIDEKTRKYIDIK